MSRIYGSGRLVALHRNGRRLVALGPATTTHPDIKAWWPAPVPDNRWRPVSVEGTPDSAEVPSHRARARRPSLLLRAPRGRNPLGCRMTAEGPLLRSLASDPALGRADSCVGSGASFAAQRDVCWPGPWRIATPGVLPPTGTSIRVQLGRLESPQSLSTPPIHASLPSEPGGSARESVALGGPSETSSRPSHPLVAVTRSLRHVRIGGLLQ